MKNSMRRCSPAIAISVGFISASALFADQVLAQPAPHFFESEAQPFGLEGRAGRDGTDGTSGKSGANVTWVFDGGSKEFQLDGTDGTPGSDASPGENASQCEQPRQTSQNLKAASGGRGGRGGTGGKGGDGGYATIYLQDESQLNDLKGVFVSQRGGHSARGGRGAHGGSPCVCSEPRFTANMCTWTLLRHLKTETSWSRSGYNVSAGCSGATAASPAFPSDVDLVRYDYQWTVDVDSQTFTCSNGNYGSDTSDQGTPNDGSFGGVEFRIGQPRETNGETTDSLKVLVNRNLTLSSFLGASREGLESLLAPGSNTGTQYFVTRYVEKPVKIVWSGSVSLDQSGLASELVRVQIQTDNGQPSVGLNRLFWTDKQRDSVQVSKQEIDGVLVYTFRFVGASSGGGTVDPGTIRQCSVFQKKGAALCEQSGKCLYEPDTGSCVPRS